MLSKKYLVRVTGVGMIIWHWASPVKERRETLQTAAAAAAVGYILAVPEAIRPDAIDRPSQWCRLRFAFRPWGRRRWMPPLLHRHRSVFASWPARRTNFRSFIFHYKQSNTIAQKLAKNPFKIFKDIPKEKKVVK